MEWIQEDTFRLALRQFWLNKARESLYYIKDGQSNHRSINMGQKRKWHLSLQETTCHIFKHFLTRVNLKWIFDLKKLEENWLIFYPCSESKHKMIRIMIVDSMMAWYWHNFMTDMKLTLKIITIIENGA